MTFKNLLSPFLVYTCSVCLAYSIADLHLEGPDLSKGRKEEVISLFGALGTVGEST